MKEDNKFKLLSCLVKNKMETAILNDCQFYKTGK